MITFIRGKLIEINPSYIIMDINKIGFFVKISINTYNKILKINESIKKNELYIYTHLFFREENYTLYGFFDKIEREFFKCLISVNGIGPSIAIIILSSLTPKKIADAITKNEENTFKCVKGIGSKTAKRILIELKDKIPKISFCNDDENENNISFHIKEEALNALLTLGFSSKNEIEKILNNILIKYPNISIEELIKKSLNYL